MENQTTITSQYKAARLAGLLYLIAMATGLFAEFYVRFPSTLIVSGDAAKTASYIMANERLYRIGIANNIITFAIDVVLIWAHCFSIILSTKANPIPVPSNSSRLCSRSKTPKSLCAYPISKPTPLSIIK
jgi:hypothetical protein